MKLTHKWISLFLAALITLSMAGSAVAESASAVYTAETAGRNGPLTVGVEVAGEEILRVEVAEHAEVAGMADGAIARIPATIAKFNEDAAAGGDTLFGQSIDHLTAYRVAAAGFLREPGGCCVYGPMCGKA